MTDSEKQFEKQRDQEDLELEVPERYKPEPGYVESFGLNPIRKLGCRIKDCENDLHCFYARSEKRLVHPRGHCQGCGADLIHWESARVVDITDPAEKRRLMERELLRHYFWEVGIDPKAADYARKHGRRRIRELLRKRIEELRRPDNPRDGWNVGFKEHPVNYARHGTATCCRVCVAYWFGYPPDTTLTDEQIDRLYNFARYYIDVRFADIPDEIAKSPRRGSGKKQDAQWIP